MILASIDKIYNEYSSIIRTELERKNSFTFDELFEIINNTIPSGKYDRIFKNKSSSILHKKVKNAIEQKYMCDLIRDIYKSNIEPKKNYPGEKLSKIIDKYKNLIKKEIIDEKIEETSNKKIKEIEASIYMLSLFRNEVIADANDDVIELSIMEICKRLAIIFFAYNIYFVRKKGSSFDILGWYVENNYDIIDSFTLINSLYKLENDKITIDDNNYEVISTTLNDNTELLIITEELPDKIYDKKVFLTLLIPFFERNIKNLSFLSKDNSKVYGKKLMLCGKKGFSLKCVYSEKINILHLSDMHIYSIGNTRKNRFLYTKRNDELLSFFESYKYETNEFAKIFLIDYNSKETIDFIVITGDAVNASKTSSDIYENYLEAIKNIEVIAKAILGNTWFKRLIIIPGNHDYGMITELEIVFKDRAYSHSFVSKKNPTSFEKFVFFHLMFESVLLKNEINVLNNSNCVEKKYFIPQTNVDKKISFFIFNTSNNSNSLISNKVNFVFDQQFDYSSDYNIFLMHHTKLFKIDYYRDANKIDDYGDYAEYAKYAYGLEQSEKEMIINAFGEYPFNDINNYELIFDKIEEYNKIIEDKLNTNTLDENQKNALKNIKARNNYLKSLLNVDNSASSYTAEIGTFLLWFKDTITDRNKFDNFFEKIINENKYIIILGGHRHIADNGHDGPVYYYEVARTFNERKIIANKENYGILCIDLTNKDGEKTYTYELKKDDSNGSVDETSEVEESKPTSDEENKTNSSNDSKDNKE